MGPPEMRVSRAGFVIEEPWTLPDGVERVALRRATDGAAPRLKTTIAVFADDICLNVLFQSEDDGVVATLFEHDAPLYREDVVEVFLAPSDPRRYFEIEVSPVGTTFDAIIDSPNGTRDGMRDDVSWDCKDLFAAVRRMPHAMDVIIRIPFASLGARPAGAWRGNFFRIDRSAAHGDEFSAWSPTLKNPADFHVAAAFGRLLFAQ